MKAKEPVILKRDCAAIQIPSGQQLTLPAGTQLTIRRSLGGAYTAATEEGCLVRIASTDADAMGMEIEAGSEKAVAAEQPADLEKQVWDQLKTCFDPEIPVNIVDLGLVYDCQITPILEGGNRVDVKFTLTAPGCGMAGVLQADMEGKIRNLPGVKDVSIEVVFEPPWNQSMMSDAAKLQLGFM